YSLFNIHAILGITTCKFIPSHYLEAVYFNPALLSGEDTVFYCYLYAKFNPKIEVINLDKEVVYYRLLNENSVSRGKFSYDFNIAQRLDVLEDRKSTRLNSSHVSISYAVFCLKKKK